MLDRLTDQSQRSELASLLMQHYVIHCDDVRVCPNASCGYAGIVPLNPDSQRIECSEPLECLQCGTAWRDPLQVEQRRGLQAIWHQLVQDLPSFEAAANSLTTLLTAEPCPECGVMVQKTGGCAKMICSKCKFVFCWSCLQSYKDYKH